MAGTVVCAREQSTVEARQLQRSRMLDAVVALVAERGPARVSVADVTARAHTSRRAFYDAFADLDGALIEVLEIATAQVSALAADAFAGAETWRDGMRGALAAVLSFFDVRPQLAEVCLVQCLAATPRVLRERDRVVGEFRDVVVAHLDHDLTHVSALAAEGTLASVIGIAHARLAASPPEPLITLLAPLMGIIVAPFVDETTAAEEVARAEKLTRQLLMRTTSNGEDSSAGGSVLIPRPLRDPRAHRARACLLYLVEHPGASNNQIATAIGIRGHTQVSTLLARLQALGLLAKRGGGPGYRNAWSPTAYGERVAYALSAYSGRTGAHEFAACE